MVAVLSQWPTAPGNLYLALTFLFDNQWYLGALPPCYRGTPLNPLLGMCVYILGSYSRSKFSYGIFQSLYSSVILPHPPPVHCSALLRSVFKCVCVGVYAYMQQVPVEARRGHWSPQSGVTNSAELLVWVLRTGLESSGRAVEALELPRFTSGPFFPEMQGFFPHSLKTAIYKIKTGKKTKSELVFLFLLR